MNHHRKRCISPENVGNEEQWKEKLKTMRMRKKDKEKEGKMQAFSYLAIGRRLSPEPKETPENEADEWKRERKAEREAEK